MPDVTHCGEYPDRAGARQVDGHRVPAVLAVRRQAIAREICYKVRPEPQPAPARAGPPRLQTQKNDNKAGFVHIVRSIEDAKALEDTEVGVSDWVVVDQERINRFAQATDDFQWIHVDEERAARELPGGKTIAHGYLTLSLIPSLTKGFVEVKNLERAINFGSNKVRYYAMVPVGARVRARTVLKQARKRGNALHIISETTIEVDGERKPACVAETIGVFFLRDPA